jgi:Transcription factor WhiB
VQRECLGFALDEGIEWGVWGGAMASERKRLAARGITGAMIARFGARVGEGREVMADDASFGGLLAQYD